MNEDKIFYDIVRNESSGQIQLIEKILLNQELFNRWIYLKNLGLSLCEYFEKKGYRRVVIYGMAALGSRLLEELEKGQISVPYCVDRNPLIVDVRNRMKIIKPSDEWEKTIDVVVVTAVYSFEDIKKGLTSKVDCPIISLKDIIWSV